MKFFAALGIFFVTYSGFVLADIPVLRMKRHRIALLGGFLTLLAGILSLQQAYLAVDFHTIFLLMGMMVLIEALYLSGFFKWISETMEPVVKTPMQFLAVTIAVSGLLSAFLINDIVCLALTPFLIHTAHKMKLNPLPYLMALATASNIGSCAALTGNPQNILIAGASHLSYLYFMERVGPAAAVSLLFDFILLALIYKKDFSSSSGENILQQLEPGSSSKLNSSKVEQQIDQKMMIKAGGIAFLTIFFFFTGLSLVWIALGSGILTLLLLGGKRIEILKKMDWNLLLLFIGLFIVIKGFEIHVLDGLKTGGLQAEILASIPKFAAASVILSNLVSNVPAVLLFRPFVRSVLPASRRILWLTLAMSSTFAGNLTLIGSIANLIVAEKAAQENIKLSFWYYLKGGFYITIFTVGFGTAWLCFVKY
jgi:Na+/H+ antiporter NhaD/arsenite permease-like protein